MLIVDGEKKRHDNQDELSEEETKKKVWTQVYKRLASQSDSADRGEADWLASFA